MKTKTLKIISNGFFAVSILFSVAVLIITYVDRAKLPKGLCPIQDNKGWITASIVLLVISIIVTTFVDYKVKKSARVVEAEQEESEITEEADEVVVEEVDDEVSDSSVAEESEETESNEDEDSSRE